MLPPVSLPIEKPTRPAAVAAPGPALDPDAPSSSTHGFIVWPPNQMSFSASAPRLSFAISTAPASSRRRTTAESFGGHPIPGTVRHHRSSRSPQCRADPSPRTGYRAAARDTFRPRSRRRPCEPGQRGLSREGDDAAEPVDRTARCGRDRCSSAARRSACARSIQRESCVTGRKRDVASLAGSRQWSGSAAAAHETVARRSAGRAGDRRIPSRRGDDHRRVRLSAVPPAAPAAAPSWCANSRPLGRALLPSSEPGRASRLRRTFTATPRARRPVSCRRSAVRLAGRWNRAPACRRGTQQACSSRPSCAVIRNCRRVFTRGLP